ncbi:hypothetical protein CPL00368_CDS0121 [Klebsiella phage DevonBitter]
MTKQAYLILNNGFAVGTTFVDLGHTKEEWQALDAAQKNQLVNEAAWEYAEAYVEMVDDELVIVVSLGAVGCDAHVHTDFQSEEEWDELDLTHQNALINEAFWEVVDCYVAFCKDDDEANTCTNYGYEHDDVECA